MKLSVDEDEGCVLFDEGDASDGVGLRAAFDVVVPAEELGGGYVTGERLGRSMLGEEGDCLLVRASTCFS